jgi:S-adenosylmethionine uptake transporter
MPASDNRRGALLMTAGMATFALSDACMKGLGPEMPLFQAIALRGLGVSAALGLLAWAQGARWRGVAARDRRLMGLRALAEMATAWTYLSALRLLPIANVSAIFQASPLALTLAGALVLGERVGRWRWAAVAVGFAGVLLIVRPGGEGFGWPSVLVLLSVLCVTGRDLASRSLAPAVPSTLVAAVTALGVTLFGLAGSLFVDWAPLTERGALLLGGAQAFLLMGYLAVVSAMRRGEVSFVAPFRYASLLASLTVGVVLFGTFPDALTLLGAGVVVGSGLTMLVLGRHEARERPDEGVPGS